MTKLLLASTVVFMAAQALVTTAEAGAIPYAQFYAGFDTSDDVDSQLYKSTTVNLSIPDHAGASAAGHLNLTDPSLTVSVVNTDATINTNAFFQLFYNIEFTGPGGSVPVMVQSIGNATGGGQASLFIYPKEGTGTYYPVAYTGSSASNSYNTNNEIIDFNTNVLYTVLLSTYVSNSGTAYIDPTFTIAGSDASSYSFNTNLSLDGSTVGPVPLPASAPMFGAALLGLAGIGYAAKRKKAAAAA